MKEKLKDYLEHGEEILWHSRAEQFEAMDRTHKAYYIRRGVIAAAILILLLAFYIPTAIKTGAGARAYEWLFHQASSFLSHLPGVVLFAVAAIVSSFMLAAQLPQLRRSFAAHLPQLARGKLASALGHIRAALGGWLLAQLKLMGVTFLILPAGFLLLRTEYPLLFALLTTLIDALPVFGTGTVLIPWALLEFLHGNTACGVGFLILYAVAASPTGSAAWASSSSRLPSCPTWAAARRSSSLPRPPA